MGEKAWKCIVFLFALKAGVTCLELSIYPRHAMVRPGDNLHIACSTPHGIPLQSCKFFITGMPAIDFSRGRKSEATEGYRYYGLGLERGQCGISLQEIATDCSDVSKMVTVTCAAQIQGHGWSVNYMSMLVSNVTKFPLTTEHQHVVAQPGSNVSILCSTTGVAITSCYFQGKYLGRVDLSDGHHQPPKVVGASAEAQGKVHYFGQGMEEGECGITLTDVKDEWSGLVWCAAKSEYGNWGYDYTTLIVAKPPSTPILKVSSTYLSLGDSLKAVCTARSFRPSVEISWEPPFDERIQDLYSDDLADARLDYEAQTYTQESVKNVSETDHLRTVRCTVKYDANKYEVVAKQKINVRFCGKRNFKGAKPLVYGGVEAKSGEFPWHVALYNNANNTHMYICGGSLISTKHFITAAHCVWDKSFRRPSVATLFAAAVGKFHREWLHEEDLEGAQKFNIAALAVHNKYRDSVRHYEDDIAVLKLDGEVIFSRHVHPICMDWSDAFQNSLLVNGNLGVVAGWGFTKNGTLSDTMQYTEIPYMDSASCSLIIPTEFRRYLAPSKYCGGFLNQNIAVCRGDSGGGMIFYQNDTMQYYLMGLVSVAPAAATSYCNPEQIAVFTQISDYQLWIKSVLDKDDTSYARQSMM